MQKQKTNKPGDTPGKLDMTLGDSNKLLDAAKKGGSLMDELTTATQTPARKKGHWEQCCGSRVWVED